MFIVFVIFKPVKEYNGGTVVFDPYATLEGGGNTPKSLIKKKNRRRRSASNFVHRATRTIVSIIGNLKYKV